jgi:hypothetical protein
MLETLAIVTFLLSDGRTAIERIYPPGGEYHRQFGHICERNKALASRQVQKMYDDKQLTPPPNSERILRIDVSCQPSTRV